MELILVIGVLAVAAWFLGKYQKGQNAERKQSAKRHSDENSAAWRSGRQENPLLSREGKVGRRRSYSGKTLIPIRWVRPGETVSVKSRQIPGGMIYVGEHLPSRHYDQPDNCLIDPGLQVASRAGDLGGATLPYWPSYADLRPDQRRTFLDWLSSGRSDPAVGIGYVFLFFYGLERRIFHDFAMDDASAITAEVERLLKLYGTNNSFKTYATKFLDAAAIITGDADLFHIEPSLDLSGYEMPLAVRTYLGRCLQRGTPLTEDEALVWILAHPETGIRTPASRCFDELRALWRHRFAAQYPKGFTVKPPKTTLRLEYRPASNAFECSRPIGNDDVPDILALKARTTRLQELFDLCTEQLDSYSRLLGRNPDARGGVEAAALLPREILGEAGGERWTWISSQLEQRFNERTYALMPVSALLDALQIQSAEKARLPASTASQIATILDRLDVGHEPDRRHGGSTPAIDGRIILFRANGGGAVDAGSLAFRSARTMVEIGAIAAAADGKAAAEELESVKTDLKAFPDLSVAERERLNALAALLFRDAPGQAAALKRLSMLPDAEKKRITQSAISAVLADGHVSPGEVKFIEKLHKSLGYPPGDVYAALHRGSVVVDEPVSVAPAEPSRGIPIPASPAGASATIRLDDAKLERIRNETAAVSSLLSDIFSEDTPAEPVTPRAVASEEELVTTMRSPYAGLDEAHAGLLAAVAAKGSMDRADFDRHARASKLLPDGAIETINEWAFERFDEPVIEDGEKIVVVDHLLPELSNLDEAA